VVSPALVLGCPASWPTCSQHPDSNTPASTHRRGRRTIRDPMAHPLGHAVEAETATDSSDRRGGGDHRCRHHRLLRQRRRPAGRRPAGRRRPGPTRRRHARGPDRGDPTTGGAPRPRRARRPRRHRHRRRTGGAPRERGEADHQRGLACARDHSDRHHVADLGLGRGRRTAPRALHRPGRDLGAGRARGLPGRASVTVAQRHRGQRGRDRVEGPPHVAGGGCLHLEQRRRPRLDGRIAARPASGHRLRPARAAPGRRAARPGPPSARRVRRARRGRRAGGAGQRGRRRVLADDRLPAGVAAGRGLLAVHPAVRRALAARHPGVDR
jgi:hypothetical protein